MSQHIKLTFKVRTWRLRKILSVKSSNATRVQSHIMLDSYELRIQNINASLIRLTSKLKTSMKRRGLKPLKSWKEKKSHLRLGLHPRRSSTYDGDRSWIRWRWVRFGRCLPGRHGGNEDLWRRWMKSLKLWRVRKKTSEPLNWCG